MTNIFEKIIQGEIPCKKVFENEKILAFHDIYPAAPVHVIIVPKKSFKNLSDAKPEDATLLGEMMLAAKDIAKELGISNYRLITNNGEEAGQSIFHFHFHLLGGRPLGHLG
jgi:histidine triad (HIT) family protein